MLKVVAVLAILAAGCSQAAQVAGPATFSSMEASSGLGMTSHPSTNRPPVVQIQGVYVHRSGHLVQLQRPFRMRTGEHAVISIVWFDPDGDLMDEVSTMTGVPGKYIMGTPVDEAPPSWQADDMIPHRAGLARVRAVVTDSRGDSAEAVVAIHVSGR